MAALATRNRLKAWALKALDLAYEASLASVFLFCLLVFVTSVVAMAISVGALQLPEFHRLQLP